MLKFQQFASLLFLFACGTVAQAQIDQMIDTQKVDFGVIATGSEVQKQVTIRNVHQVPYHIAEVKTSCACAKATIDKYSIEPGDMAVITVQMNTRNFRQRKDSNVIIRFSSPVATEHRIPVTAYIRTDVVFNPGSVQFGEVEVGTEGTASVDIAYAGRPDWDIDDIKITNRYLKATLEPGLRSGGNVNYKLTMSLNKAAPLGGLRDIITIVTNDRTNPNVPLMIEGTVTPDITITPAVVNVGPVAPGQRTLKQIVVKGKKPFRIEDIDCKDMSDCFKANLSDAARPLHVVPIEFNVPNRPGKFSEELVVKIMGRDEPLRFNVTGVITN
ncbi:MAG: DUF1573 domain-containing protein [Planctomycetaceae bacterium]